MKVIIAGSRTIIDYQLVCNAIKESGFKITEVVSGCAKGVDTLGEQWAGEHGIPVKKFPANWNEYGLVAGHIRNAQMGKYGESLIAIKSNNSRGTKSMIEIAQKKNIPIFIKEV